jgi:hypothetical protein
MLIAPGCVAVFLCALNAARFGSITEFGHNYLPEFLESPDGQFSLTYLPYNLFRCVRLYTGNFEIPRFDGWAFYLVMPIYICALASPLLSKRRPDTLFWLTIAVMLAHLCFTCAHKTLGGWHFGCRYLIDALPLAYLLCMQTRRDCAVRRLDGRRPHRQSLRHRLVLSLLSAPSPHCMRRRLIRMPNSLWCKKFESLSVCPTTAVHTKNGSFTGFPENRLPENDLKNCCRLFVRRYCPIFL